MRDLTTEIATVIRDNGQRAIVVTFTPDEWAAHVAAERSAGYDLAVAKLRDEAVVELVAQFAKHHNPETKATCWTCNSWSRSVVNAIAQALEVMKETTP